MEKSASALYVKVLLLGGDVLEVGFPSSSRGGGGVGGGGGVTKDTPLFFFLLGWGAPKILWISTDAGSSFTVNGRCLGLFLP